LNERYSNLTLEQFLLNELSSQEADAINHDMQKDIGLQKRIAAIKESDVILDASIDENECVRTIKYRTKIATTTPEPEPFFLFNYNWGRWTYALPILAVLVISSVLVKQNQDETSVNLPGMTLSEEGVRFKGLSPHINIYHQSSRGILKLEDNALLHEGDTLQLSYVAAGKQYGIIFSIDGRQVLTFHYPKTDGALTPLNISGEFTLSQSYELDDAPNFEHFYFLTSTSPIDVAKLKRLIENNLGSIDKKAVPLNNIPDTYNQSIFTVKKPE